MRKGLLHRHLKAHAMDGIVSPPPNSHAEALTPSVVVFGGGASGGNEG